MPPFLDAPDQAAPDQAAPDQAAPDQTAPGAGPLRVNPPERSALDQALDVGARLQLDDAVADALQALRLAELVADVPGADGALAKATPGGVPF